MSIEVQFVFEYDFRLALCFGHVTLEGKAVATAYGYVYHVNDHNGWRAIK
jgi:hypothetical protein